MEPKTTTTRNVRYGQCDGTCTVDCGHCKGRGPLGDVRHRLEQAQATLQAMVATAVAHGENPERLRGKAQGVDLALSYVDELIRAQP